VRQRTIEPQPVADRSTRASLLTLTVLAVNLVAAWLRVVLDPQEREKRHAATVLGGGKQL
jgi:hypothetical protein